ncbi:MAG: hypothetical protein VXZ72_02340 [Chlamydiota bacterium]|nr:hypothetical protein [Chlamydiota bacterium]
MFYEKLAAAKQEKKRKELSTKQMLGVGAAGALGGIGATGAIGTHNNLLSRSTAKDLKDAIFYSDGSTRRLEGLNLKKVPRGLKDALEELSGAQETYDMNSHLQGPRDALRGAQRKLRDALSERAIQKNRALLGGTVLGGGLVAGYGAKKLFDRHNREKTAERKEKKAQRVIGEPGPNDIRLNVNEDNNVLPLRKNPRARAIVEELHGMKRFYGTGTKDTEDMYVNRKKLTGQLTGAMLGGGLGAGAGALLGANLVPSRGMRAAAGGLLGAGIGGYAGGRLGQRRGRDNVDHATKASHSTVKELFSPAFRGGGSRAIRIGPAHDRNAPGYYIHN